MHFIELFAGIGLFRLGLEAIGPQWQCVLANDIADMKARAYALNFGSGHFKQGDVAHLTAADLPVGADLITASFPCQDVSLAGNRAGLNGERTANFYHFTRLVQELAQAGRAPGTVLLENVTGLLTSHRGVDIRAVLHTLHTLGYGLDLLLLDAAHWLPQSRPRIFIVGRLGQGEPLGLLNLPAPHAARPPQIQRVLQANADLNWALLDLPPLPAAREQVLTDLIEEEAAAWFGDAELARELEYIRHTSRARLEAAQQAAMRDGRTRHLAGYRRMRQGLVCLELRDDGLAGCLRTATGGSSRQLLVEVRPTQTRLRYMTPREYARLMGVPDSFRLPANTREALHGLGDAVAVPVITWLGQVLEAQPEAGAAPAPAPAPQLAPVR